MLLFLELALDRATGSDRFNRQNYFANLRKRMRK
jgi:hypothetical protein